MSRLPRPKKSLGQNFLVDGNLQRKIVEALQPGPEDEVLEIGPGTGALTQHLAGRCRSLHLVELDRELAGRLQEDLGSVPGVEVLNKDIMGVSLEDLTPDVSHLKVVGNIPYNITTPILFHLLERPRPGEILLMVQKEVGERILARPGTSAYGALSVGVRIVAEVHRVLKIPASAFRPIPTVDSVVIRIRPFRPEPFTAEEEAAVRRLTRLAFQQRRKQFQTILRKQAAEPLTPAQLRELQRLTGFDLTRRPETFSPTDFVSLAAGIQQVS